MIRPENAVRKIVSHDSVMSQLEKEIDDAITIQMAAGFSTAEVILTGKFYAMARVSILAVIAKYEKTWEVKDTTGNRKYMYTLEFTPLSSH